MSFAVSKAGRRSHKQRGVDVTTVLNLFMILIPALLTSFQIVQTSILNLELAGLGAVEGENYIPAPTYFMTTILARTKDGRIVCEFSRYRYVGGESIAVDTMIEKSRYFDGWGEIDTLLTLKLDSLFFEAKKEVKSFLDTTPEELIAPNWREIKNFIAQNPAETEVMDSVISRLNLFILISVDSIGEAVSGESVNLNDLVSFMKISQKCGFQNNYLQPPPWWPTGS
ncbi:hypothetical protein JW890_07715 [candidate division WOR-3 bacterium]|nr:hypothetical protein [candidate division WOR-3 bacterium]